MSGIKPCLWFRENAEEAVAFYASVLPDSRVLSVTAGVATVIEFTLMGQDFMAIGAASEVAFNHAMSLVITCEDQAEIDRLWSALGEGGAPGRCGWVKDRFGLSWQIVPKVLGEMMKDPDRSRAARVTEAMLKMTRLDIEGLRHAYG